MKGYRAATDPATEELVSKDSSSLEFCIGLSLATGALFTGVAVFSPTDNYIRFALLAVAGGSAALAALSALGRPSTSFGRIPLLAIAFLAGTGLQEYAQSGWLKTVPYAIGILLAIAVTRAELDKLLRRMPAAWLLVVLVALVPINSPDSYAAGRQWLPGVPGRYFAFSNPDALGLMAGVGLLLALSGLRRVWNRALLAASLLLFVLTAAYTTLAAVVIGVAVVAVSRIPRVARLAETGSILLAGASVVGLMWLPTPGALNFFTWLHTHISLTNRTLIWVRLVQLADERNYFWTGLGDRQVADFTLRIYGVGSAHTTLLQLVLSKGFVTTLVFILLVLASVRAALRLAPRTSDPAPRYALALMAFWFVTSLASIQTVNPLVISLMTCLGAVCATASRGLIPDPSPTNPLPPGRLISPRYAAPVRYGAATQKRHLQGEQTQ